MSARMPSTKTLAITLSSLRIVNLRLTEPDGRPGARRTVVLAAPDKVTSAGREVPLKLVLGAAAKAVVPAATSN